MRVCAHLCASSDAKEHVNGRKNKSLTARAIHYSTCTYKVFASNRNATTLVRAID